MSIKNQRNLPYFALAIILATVASLFGLNYTINQIAKKAPPPMAMTKTDARSRTLLGSDDSAIINKTMKKKLQPKSKFPRKTAPTFKVPPRKPPSSLNRNQPQRRLRNGHKAADIQRSRRKPPPAPKASMPPQERPVYPPNVRDDYFRGPPPQLPPGFPELPPNPTEQDIENFREEMRKKIESGEIPPPPPLPPQGFFPPPQDRFFPPPGSPGDQEDYEDQMYDNMYGPPDDQDYDSRRRPPDFDQENNIRSDLESFPNTRHSDLDPDYYFNQDGNWEDEDYAPNEDDIDDPSYFDNLDNPENRDLDYQDHLADQDLDFLPPEADLELIYEIFEEFGYED